MNIDFNIVFSSLDFILSKYKGFSWNRTEGIFRHLFADCCSGYISDVGTSGGLVYFSIFKNNWILSRKLDIEF